jgi:hypothetical protein
MRVWARLGWLWKEIQGQLLLQERVTKIVAKI